jgi:hypothetical protein
MINPNKFYSVEKVTVTMEGSSELVVTQVVIDQIEPNGNRSVLYQINRLSERGKHKEVGYPHEVKLHFPNKQADPNVPIRWIEPIISIDTYIDKLRGYFSRGRVQNGKFLTTVDGMFYHGLTYKHVKNILRFENRASRVLSNKPDAIREIDPTKIKGFITCDNYILESWISGLDKHHYSALTSDPDMSAWIQSMKY